MTSTASEPRLCECGAVIPVVEIMGHQIPMRLCFDCSEAEIAREQAEARKSDEQAVLERAGATPRLLDWTLDSITADLAEQRTQAIAWLDGYRAGERQNLWLSSKGAGVGKTCLAWALVRELSLDAVAAFWDADEEYRGSGPGTPALFVNWRDLLNDLRDEYRDGTGGASKLYERACRVRVLALDDLGAERPTPWALEALAGLVQARYDGKLPSIVTANFYSDELAVRLGGDDPVVGTRIVTRLVEGAVGIRFDGSQLRRRAA